MKLPSSILFVGAHCDDIELLAGGLLSRVCRTGTRVGVLVFSDHRGVIDTDAAARARAEFCANVEWLGARTKNVIKDHTVLLLSACSGAFQAERGSIYSVLEA